MPRVEGIVGRVETIKPRAFRLCSPPPLLCSLRLPAPLCSRCQISQAPSLRAICSRPRRPRWLICRARHRGCRGRSARTIVEPGAEGGAEDADSMRGSAEVVAVARDVASSSPSKPAPASDMTRYADPPILTCRCRSSASFCILGSPLVFFLEIPFSYIAAFRSEFPLAFCADSSAQIYEWPI